MTSFAIGGHVGMIFGWLIPSLFVMTIAAALLGPYEHVHVKLVDASGAELYTPPDVMKKFIRVLEHIA